MPTLEEHPTVRSFQERAGSLPPLAEPIKLDSA
jgi:hypothetical protein